MKTSKLIWLDGPRDGASDVFVYIHGIFSDPETFFPLRQMLVDHPVLRGKAAHYGFHYKYWRPMKENGMILADELSELNLPKTVTLFGHSMGGLIARLALLTSPVPLGCVKRIVMFGTPNHGAIRAFTLQGLAFLAFPAAASIGGFFFRSPGIRELTRVYHVFKEPLTQSTRATDVQYVTIPGTFYHRQREALEFANRPRAASRLLGVTTLVGKLSGIQRPDLPHDGIVEESSVKLGS
jgi:pimeloyl-ACP methyl ester carboxylesterase